MNERIVTKPLTKSARDASNILYEEMRKYDGNRCLNYVFDEENEFKFDQEFTAAAQVRDNHFTSAESRRKCLKQFSMTNCHPIIR